MMKSTFFVRWVRGRGFQNPFVPGETILGGDTHPCGVIVSEVEPTVVSLDHIRAVHKGIGAGSLALEQLKDISNQTGVTIVGRVGGSKFKEKGSLTEKQLVAWYTRHGFTVKKGVLEYKPK